MRILLFLFCFSVQSVIAQKIVLTKAPIPYLEYGLGEDRLGGAKMGYIDTNVQLLIIDSVKEKYRVQLSERHFAYVPKQAVRTDSFVAYKPYHLTGNLRSWGDSAFDYIQLLLDARLPYKLLQKQQPTELVVDVYGVASNTNWLIQTQSAQNVKQVWYEQPEEDLFRLHILLHSRNHWGSVVYYDRNRLTIKMPRPPKTASLAGLTIAVDAGHGGANSGARGVLYKRYEKEYTLQLAERLRSELLAKQAQVYMTRTSDTDIAMPDRTLALRAIQPTLLISLHHNSTGADTVTGLGCYYRYPGFMELNAAILQEVVKQSGMANWGLVGNFNFALSGPIEYPNCLVELGFLSNPADERRIADSNFQKTVARAIATGIEKYLAQSLLPDGPVVVQQTVIQPVQQLPAVPEPTRQKTRRELRREAREN